LPKDVFTYLNLGPIRNKGIELSVEHTINRVWSAYANYSFQDTPEVLTPASGQLPYFTAEVGVPAKNRFNLGVNWGGKRFVIAIPYLWLLLFFLIANSAMQSDLQVF
jgi:outer membrane receptor protein involved in Fe transport